MEEKIKFSTRQALLDSVLMGNQNQLTILVDDRYNYLTFTTIENFIPYSAEMNNEYKKLEKEGFAFVLEVGGYHFLAKTLIRYIKRMHEDSWELVGAFGEIKSQSNFKV